MHRFYGISLPDGQVQLTAEDARHALRVLRMQPGDAAEIILDGSRYLGSIISTDMECVRFSLNEKLPSTEPGLRITLFQGLPKADKMDWIVQKAVEIGVHRVIPVEMSRCVTHMEQKDQEKKRERWQKIAREAGKQSGRCVIPEVTLPVSLSRMLSLASDLDACIVPWEEARSLSLKAFAASNPRITSIGILIGPEGGIDEKEIQQIQSVFHPLTLGPRILRTETAGLVSAAVLMALYGEME